MQREVLLERPVSGKDAFLLSVPAEDASRLVRARVAAGWKRERHGRMEAGVYVTLKRTWHVGHAYTWTSGEQEAPGVANTLPLFHRFVHVNRFMA